jgi:hypothetical protein
MTGNFSSVRRMFLSTLMVCFASFSVQTCLAAETPFSGKVKASMADLKAEAAKLGVPRLDGENLHFGASKINGDYTLVDAIKAKHGGTATLFVKKGSGFVRVSTNVLRDGQRAVGTQLDPAGPAMAAIKQGNTYYGIVDILGKLYDTAYEPIKSAGGETIGVYYVGYPLE